MNIDTIAAIATAMASAGIGIIRISGREAVEVADRVFSAKSGKSLQDSASHTIHYGFIVEDGTMIDEVLVMLMKAPHSYTREDVVEINCHGGVRVTRRILDLVLEQGARPAEPGEFTKRAFLNGRIDLSQAEAVMDLISSQNDAALEASVRQLRGNVREELKGLRDCLLQDMAFIEAALDDVNVYRFAEYLKKFCKETQFLVITHRKGTMEAADTVYGVTMEENGISKLLSLKLK